MPMSRRTRSLQAWIPFFVFLLGIQEGVAQTGANPADGDDVAVVAFVNVAVVSMQDDAVRHAQTVIIRGDRIVSIGPVRRGLGGFPRLSPGLKIAPDLSIYLLIIFWQMDFFTNIRSRPLSGTLT